MQQAIDREEIRDAVRRSRLITITTTGYFSDERKYIDRVLDIFLEEAGLEVYKQKLSYCVHELAGNAIKGNTKRVYFEEKGLNIHNESEYWIGMEGFRRETVDRISHYLRRQRELGLKIKLQFKLNGPNVMIGIRQNIGLTRIERDRIRTKLSVSGQYGDMTEAYARIEDSSEGAGLGIVMMIMMLRNIGLNRDVIRYYFGEEETYVLLKIRLQEHMNSMTS
jgi:hypothetical protein